MQRNLHRTCTQLVHGSPLPPPPYPPHGIEISEPLIQVGRCGSGCNPGSRPSVGPVGVVLCGEYGRQGFPSRNLLINQTQQHAKRFRTATGRTRSHDSPHECKGWAFFPGSPSPTVDGSPTAGCPAGIKSGPPRFARSWCSQKDPRADLAENSRLNRLIDRFSAPMNNRNPNRPRPRSIRQ